MTSDEFLATYRRVTSPRALPKPLSLVAGVERIQRGEDPVAVRKDTQTTAARLSAALAANDPVAFALGMDPAAVSEKAIRNVRKILGQLIVGRAAELVFEDLYKTEMSTEEFELRDQRGARSGTDYRVHNGNGRPLYRLNIKFHGSQFKRAPELVGLESTDCFPLATYKIKNALDKQDEEHLPYIFAIVGVPNLSGDVVAAQIPTTLIEAAAIVAEAPKVTRARDFEDDVVRFLVQGHSAAFAQTYAAIRAAQWYVLSARRAVELLKDRLFERVYALRVRGFAQQFRAAELDMHFSLTQDLTPISRFFETLRTEGQTKVASLLERGSI